MWAAWVVFKQNPKHMWCTQCVGLLNLFTSFFVCIFLIDIFFFGYLLCIMCTISQLSHVKSMTWPQWSKSQRMCSPFMRVSVSLPQRENLKRNPMATVALWSGSPAYIYLVGRERNALIMSVFPQGTRHPDNVPVEFLLTFHVRGQVCVCYGTGLKGTCLTLHCDRVGSDSRRVSTILGRLKRSLTDRMDAVMYCCAACCVCCEVLAGTDKSRRAYFARELVRLVL